MNNFSGFLKAMSTFFVLPLQKRTHVEQSLEGPFNNKGRSVGILAKTGQNANSHFGILQNANSSFLLLLFNSIFVILTV
jgi:hypothetical protein